MAREARQRGASGHGDRRRAGRAEAGPGAGTRRSEASRGRRLHPLQPAQRRAAAGGAHPGRPVPDPGGISADGARRGYGAAAVQICLASMVKESTVVTSTASNSFSPYVTFERDEWARLRAATPLTLTDQDLVALRAINEYASLD